MRLRKETIGVQAKTIRLRWTYPTVCVEEKCDVNLNLFNEPELSYMRLVIVVENFTVVWVMDLDMPSYFG